MKKQRSDLDSNNPFDHLSEELVFSIIDLLTDKKSFSIVCKSFYAFESRHRRTLIPLRSDYIPKILVRYPNVTRVDLSMCPRVTDESLCSISSIGGLSIRSVDLSKLKSFSNLGLCNLARSCSNLVEIDVSNVTNLGDCGAQAIGEARCLQRLWMDWCKSVSDIGIGCIAVGCNRLRLLSLKWCVGVGDLGVGLIAVKCKEIRSLDISYLPITNKCLHSILKLKHLEELGIIGCFGVDDAGLVVLQQECKSLMTLDMSSCQNVGHVGLSSLTSVAECLQQLNLAYGCHVTFALADSLQKLLILQSIKLDGCSVTCSGLKAIGDWCVSLTELSLSKCLGVMDEGLSSLVSKHSNLRKLDLTCCHNITNVSITHITNSCTLLTSLKLESCASISREAFVLIGQHCRLLEVLDLTDNEVDDEGLKSIARCCRLMRLKLGICLNISDDGLSYIGMGCSALIELDLYRSEGITDLGILEIAGGCTDVEMINLAYCKDITDSSLTSLSKCPRLNTLGFRGCHNVTASGLASIALGCKQLTELDLKKCCNVNDSGMIPLARCSQNLKRINLSYTSVTEVGFLCLADISCLQSMTMLHVKGLGPSGLVAALLACKSLTKVKLQSCFKSRLPRQIFKHLEARGCSIQWKDKVFQHEVEPRCWKVQLEGFQYRA